MTHPFDDDPIRQCRDFFKEAVKEFNELFRVHPRTPERYEPASDLYETSEAYILVVDLPGIDETTATIEIKENVLYLSGDRPVEPLTQTARPVYGLRPTGTFQRRFSFYKEIDSAEVSAKFKQGVLTITLKKALPEKGKKVRIDFAE